MDIGDIEKLFSQKRLVTYYDLFNGNKSTALAYYQLNTQIAESLYPLLSNFEIVLRNSIHNFFAVHFKINDWYSLVKYPELRDQIIIAERKIVASKNWLSTDKLVSELTLGFWTSLLNKQYAKEFWKPLMYSFPLLDKRLKHRDEISYKLNQIRKFRNRIFHYEPICNDLNLLVSNHRTILEALNWINADVVKWTKNIDRFEGLYKQALKLRQLE